MQIVSNLRTKLPESVLNYLRSECLEERTAEFGVDVKVYPIDEVTINGVEVLMDWGNASKNFDGLAKKDISFKWEDGKVNETRVFEVCYSIPLRMLGDRTQIYVNVSFTAKSTWSWLARTEAGSLK